LDAVIVNYSVDAARAGGTISVRLESPTAAPVAQLPILFSGGYGSYLPRPAKLKEPVRGRHDVYLTFAGKNQGYQGLANVNWIQFKTWAPADAIAATQPAPERTASTRPTTKPAVSNESTGWLRGLLGNDVKPATAPTAITPGRSR
jgi:hypothetical protein